MLIFTIFILSSCSFSDDKVANAKHVGDYLIKATIDGKLNNVNPRKHPNIVFLGDGLKNKLNELKSKLSKQCIPEISKGDADIGNGTATHLMYLVCNESKLIGIRLRYDKAHNAFNILGYWTSGL